MTFTKEIYDSLVHVRQFYPEIEIVVFTSDMRWHYVSEYFEKSIFDMQKINIEILETALNSIKQFPAVFEFWQYK